MRIKTAARVAIPVCLVWLSSKRVPVRNRVQEMEKMLNIMENSLELCLRLAAQQEGKKMLL
jgi:hypothetical protein